MYIIKVTWQNPVLGKELIEVCEQHISKHSKYTKSNIMRFLLQRFKSLK